MLGQPDDKKLQKSNLKVKNEGVGLSELQWRQDVPFIGVFFVSNFKIKWWFLGILSFGFLRKKLQKDVAVITRMLLKIFSSWCLLWSAFSNDKGV